MITQNQMAELSDLFNNENKIILATEIIKNLEEYGLGSMSKADYEAFLFNCLATSTSKSSLINNYKWMSLLKITPSKLRSLQMLSSTKFKNLNNTDDNWRLVLKSLEGKSIELEDAKKGTVRFYIEDTHAQRFVEKFANDNGSSLDYTLNRNQIVFKYEIFKLFIEELIKKTEVDVKSLITELKKDKSATLIEKEIKSLNGVFKEIAESFKDESKSEASKKLFNFLVDIITKAAKHKLGLD